MALSTQEQIAAIAVAGGVLALAFTGRQAQAGAGMVVQTAAPSERTSLELIKSGVEHSRIDAALRRDLADIFVGREVSLETLGVKERINRVEWAGRESIRFGELRTQLELGKIAGETQKYMAKTQYDIAARQAATKEQGNFFDFLGGILGLFF